jgi:pyruvate-ferredoxin/flavodoxin oxidoreductase
LAAGCLTTTFTASQGLLLMIPNMYKIAGERSPAVFHVSARALAAQGLSIFGDHSDVMAARSTGWCQLASNSVQESMDLALVAHAASLNGRLPFIHFFDGFRTSHELASCESLADEDIRALIDDAAVTRLRSGALSPDHPTIRGTAQNPDVYFQGRETVNPAYDAMPDLVQSAMDTLAERTGRAYKLFDYVGDPEAETVIIAMGSGAETVEEVVEQRLANGEKIGLIKVRLFRPFAGERLVAALPTSAKTICVLDRTKEPGAAGEPLYQDVQTALMEASGNDTWQGALPRVIGGRYGLGSKEFDPAMADGVIVNALAETPKNHFTIVINDDLGGTSIPWSSGSVAAPEGLRQALFVGLGSDGTVGANKNSIKIIAKATGWNSQAYFV